MKKPFIATWALALVAVFAISGTFAATGSGATAAARHLLQAPTVTTALSASSTTVSGSGVHDTATLAGLTGSTFTGDMVTYTVYSSQSDCTAGTSGTAEGSVSVSGNGAVAASNTFTPTAAGTYYWQAKFNGADGANDPASSDCSTEALTVTVQTTPTITTALSASSTTVGGSGVHDTATLAGLTGSTFTGDMVTYTVYSSQSDCTAGTNGTAEGSVSVSGNGAVAASNTFTPTAAGTYYWQAKFNGADNANVAASSDCSTEALMVTAETTPTITTALSASTTSVGGSGVHDTATLAGLTGSTFTGDMVTYTVYSSQSDCTAGTNGTAEGSVSVSGNGAVAASNTFTPTATGTYYWQATFNGADHTNAAASSDCSAEPLTVSTTQPTPPHGGHGHLICRPIFIWGWHHHHHHRFFICFWIGHHGFGGGQGGGGNSGSAGNSNSNSGSSGNSGGSGNNSGGYGNISNDGVGNNRNSGSGRSNGFASRGSGGQGRSGGRGLGHGGDHGH